MSQGTEHPDMATTAAISAMSARIAELEAKLEVSPDTSFDGIEARNETIRLQDLKIDALERENAELRSTELAAQQQVFDLSHKVQNLESALAKSASWEAALGEKLRVAEEALTFFKFRGATPEQKAYAMEALAKIKEES